MKLIVPAQVRNIPNFAWNPNFHLWTRHCGAVRIGAAEYGADCYIIERSAATLAYAQSRSTDVPTPAESGAYSAYSLYQIITAAEAAVAAETYLTISHAMEGHVLEGIFGVPVTVTFWAKSNKTGTFFFNVRDGGKTRSFNAPYTIRAANTWQKVIIFVPTFPAAGTYNFHSGQGAIFSWPLCAGSNYLTTTFNAWATENKAGGVGQVQLNAVNDYLNIAQLMITPGHRILPFYEIPIPGWEYLRCRTRYWKTYSEDVVPGTNTDVGAVKFLCGPDTAISYIYLPYPSKMRDNPSVYQLFGETGTADQWYNKTDLGAGGAASVSSSSSASSLVLKKATAVASADANDQMCLHYTADAEIW